ncbi:MAG: hypothetical protein IJX86_00500 [Lachnospiraceae bacterium]|nr:hypothetical protein [Lachnospiraceae bacterium]
MFYFVKMACLNLGKKWKVVNVLLILIALALLLTFCTIVVSTTAVSVSVEEGKTVFIEGASSATVVSGTVSDNSANYYSADSYLIKDAIEIDCEANSGDSGGIAYVNNGGTYNVVGICAAIDTTYGYTYVIKADNIESELNVTFY